MTQTEYHRSLEEENPLGKSDPNCNIKRRKNKRSSEVWQSYTAVM